MGVAQHHDAASGTAKQHVTFDYAKRLAKGRRVEGGPGGPAGGSQGDFLPLSPFFEGGGSSRRVCGLKAAHASPRLFRSFGSRVASLQVRRLLSKCTSKDFVFCDLRNVSVCAPTQAVGKTTERREP